LLKISVITICKNACDTIEQTIQSVLRQTYENIEYIIIDGKSTDGTMGIIKTYENRISKIISEPDSGIYDAMNKGIAISTGDILYFLNAGDRLWDKNVIKKAALEFEKNNALIIYGKSVYENIPKGLEKRYINRPYVFNKKIDAAKHIIPQQCFFYKKDVFSQIGIFDTKFRVAADMDWFLRSLNKKIPNHYIDENICVCDLSGISSFSHVKERISVFWKNMNILEFLHYSLFAFTRQAGRLIKNERLN